MRSPGRRGSPSGSGSTGWTRPQSPATTRRRSRRCSPPRRPCTATPAAWRPGCRPWRRVVVDEYGGDAAALWQTAGTGAELLARLKALPGFGDAKAKIFLALLGKQRGVRPDGWVTAAGAYAEKGSFRSVADVVDQASLLRVRAFKQEQKAAAKAR